MSFRPGGVISSGIYEVGKFGGCSVLIVGDVDVETPPFLIRVKDTYSYASAFGLEILGTPGGRGPRVDDNSGF